jgi:hypothetical protein
VRINKNKKIKNWTQKMEKKLGRNEKLTSMAISCNYVFFSSGFSSGFFSSGFFSFSFFFLATRDLSCAYSRHIKRKCILKNKVFDPKLNSD